MSILELVLQVVATAGGVLLAAAVLLTALKRMAPGSELETLIEYTRRKRQELGTQSPVGTGVACPWCGTELEEAGYIQPTDPPKQKAVCPSCGSEVSLVA